MNIQPFQEDGYQIFKNFLDVERCSALRQAALAGLAPVLAPVEYEADTGYPGAPETRDAVGGLTPRRLLTAYARDRQFRALACDPELQKLLAAIFEAQTPGASRVRLSQSHHNCIMTKHPGYSSQTLWHQDIRYWSFDQPDLVSAWFALTQEVPGNGGLWLIPGSHRLELGPERLDERLFLRPERPDNAQLIETARAVTLEPGDLLLFHCRTFHAAGTNDTQQVKLSAVFTYHEANNKPTVDTRSSMYPSVAL